MASFAHGTPPESLPVGQGQGNPPGPNCQQLVQIAIAGLANENIDEVRTSINKLRNQASCPNIKSAIYPLENIMNDNFRDYLTRRLAVQALIAIAQALGLPQGKNAYDAVMKASRAFLIDTFADIDEVRDAIVSIKKLANNPAVLEMVEPLNQLLNNPSRYDCYTRGLSVAALVAIAREQGLPAGEPALDAVMSALVGDPLDALRAGAASALIDYRNPLPSVMAALEYAYLTDSSPLVHASAYRALVILTNGAYETFGISELSFAQGSLTPSRMPSASINCLSDELYRWVKDHVFIFNPSIKLEDFKCNP
ncbi:MAG: hypothetical protein A2V67_00335 [Deltaproteobacteria bacterium RBG_13_61_14]|nr:MAG: hypothetical protein A2V67_00335 [Deltaproteobacteria bacterium RBG_13_61_14]